MLHAPCSADHSLYAIHPIPMTEVRVLRAHTPRLGAHRLDITLISGVTLPPLHLPAPAIQQFIRVVSQVSHLPQHPSCASLLSISPVHVSCASLLSAMPKPAADTCCVVSAQHCSVRLPCACSMWRWSPPPPCGAPGWSTRRPTPLSAPCQLSTWGTCCSGGRPGGAHSSPGHRQHRHQQQPCHR